MPWTVTVVSNQCRWMQDAGRITNNQMALTIEKWQIYNHIFVPIYVTIDKQKYFLYNEMIIYI